MFVLQFRMEFVFVFRINYTSSSNVLLSTAIAVAAFILYESHAALLEVI